MKKIITTIAMLCILTSTLLGGALPYSLPDDFTIDYLIMENFDLTVEDELIEITPPLKRVESRDRIIDEFVIPDVPEIDSWLIAMASSFPDNTYEECYRYISRELGEGISEKNTRFLVDRYSAEPSEGKILTMLLSGEIGEYLGKAIPAFFIKSIITERDQENIRLNMWIGDGISVYTMGYEGRNIILYINNSEIDEFIYSALGMLLLSGLME